MLEKLNFIFLSSYIYLEKLFDLSAKNRLFLKQHCRKYFSFSLLIFYHNIFLSQFRDFTFSFNLFLIKVLI